MHTSKIRILSVRPVQSSHLTSFRIDSTNVGNCERVVAKRNVAKISPLLPFWVVVYICSDKLAHVLVNILVALGAESSTPKRIQRINGTDEYRG